ncbi:hypothetical protein [Sediminibacterium soli]|uniref:hypothetical protein n=1 Tax=Sediminibacterium soli TaxID=2698829 RepID=UPI00137B7306|nr:hypothetical protein [Sediminibacterium soli]NCI47241.1 hypothetical protein [Sediminibacterium soli]
MKAVSGLVCVLLAATLQAQPPNGRPPGPTKKERLQHVSERFGRELQLTDAQKKKLVAAYAVFFDGMEVLRKKEGRPLPPPPPPPPADKAAFDKLVKTRDARVKAALSHAQYLQYLELEKKIRPPGPGQRPLPRS